VEEEAKHDLRTPGRLREGLTKKDWRRNSRKGVGRRVWKDERCWVTCGNNHPEGMGCGMCVVALL